MAYKNKYEEADPITNRRLRDINRDAYDSAVRSAYEERPVKTAPDYGELLANDANAQLDYLKWANDNPYPTTGRPKTEDVIGSYGGGGIVSPTTPTGGIGLTMDFGDLPQGTDFSYGKAPSYIDPYQQQISAITNSILNRGPFEYDYASDPSYQQYAKAYGDAGRRAMQDTLAQVSARTGGLASSYAGSASQQAYNNYMARLADKVPELRQAAYQMYMDQDQIARQNLAMLQGLSNNDYGRFQDTLGQWNADRAYDTSLWRYGVDDSRYAADRALDLAKTGASIGDLSGYKALGFDTSKLEQKSSGGGSRRATADAVAEAAAEKYGLSIDDAKKLLSIGDERIDNSPALQEFYASLGIDPGTLSGGGGDDEYDLDDIRQSLGLSGLSDDDLATQIIINQNALEEDRTSDGKITYHWKKWR